MISPGAAMHQSAATPHSDEYPRYAAVRADAHHRQPSLLQIRKVPGQHRLHVRVDTSAVPGRPHDDTVRLHIGPERRQRLRHDAADVVVRQVKVQAPRPGSAPAHVRGADPERPHPVNSPSGLPVEDPAPHMLECTEPAVEACPVVPGNRSRVPVGCNPGLVGHAVHPRPVSAGRDNPEHARAVTVGVVQRTMVGPVEFGTPVVVAAHRAAAQTHGATGGILPAQVDMVGVHPGVEHPDRFARPGPPRPCIAETLAASSLATLRSWPDPPRHVAGKPTGCSRFGVKPPVSGGGGGCGGCGTDFSPPQPDKAMSAAARINAPSRRPRLRANLIRCPPCG